MNAIDEIPTQADRLAEAVQYWREHAYLEAPPEVRSLVGYDVPPTQRSQYIELVHDRALDTAPSDTAQWQAEQGKLDLIVAFALGDEQAPAEYENNPFRRFGLTPSDIGIHNLAMQGSFEREILPGEELLRGGPTFSIGGYPFTLSSFSIG